MAAAVFGRQALKRRVAVASGSGLVVATRLFRGDLCRCERESKRIGEALCRGKALFRLPGMPHVVDDVSDDDAGRLVGDSEDEG